MKKLVLLLAVVMMVSPLLVACAIDDIGAGSNQVTVEPHETVDPTETVETYQSEDPSRIEPLFWVELDIEDDGRGNGAHSRGAFYEGMYRDSVIDMLSELNLEYEDVPFREPYCQSILIRLEGKTPYWTSHLGEGRLVWYHFEENEDGEPMLKIISGHIVSPRGLRVGDTYEQMVELYGDDYYVTSLGNPPLHQYHFDNMIVTCL